MAEAKSIQTAEALARELASANVKNGTLSVPRKTGAESGTKIRVRSVVLKTGRRWQIEEFRGARSFHRNLDAAEFEAFLAEAFSGAWGRAEFTADEAKYSVMANRRGELAVLRKTVEREKAGEQGSMNDPEQDADECVLPAHNRQKQYILAEGTPVPFLVDLGVMARDGKVVKARYDKFRQINRFLEFIEDVLPEFDAEAGRDRPLSVVDFGCGKSYLTFAVYYYLTVVKKLKARVTGLDLKSEVIGRCSALADAYGYKHLSFEVGDIASYAGEEKPDLVISLHACDTATDFALARSIRWNARVILAVPCCQHEINAQLGGKSKETQAKDESDIGAGSIASPVPGRVALESAFRFGILRERMAALITDAMRAELLEEAGYRVQILEFIDMTHTPKNLLIRAVRTRTEPDGAAAGYPARSRLGAAFGVKPTLETELEAWKKSL